MKNSCSGIKEDWCCKGKSPWKQHALKGQKLLAQGVLLLELFGFQGVLLLELLGPSARFNRTVRKIS